MADLADYRTRFGEALKRTDAWGLGSGGSKAAEQYLEADWNSRVTPPRQNLIEFSRLLPIPIHERIGWCAAVHMTALKLLYLKGDVQLPPILTVGNVEVAGKPRYQVSRQSLRRELKAGPKAKGVINVHVWLTWPDMTIYDLVLRATLLHERGKKITAAEDPDGLAIAGAPDAIEPGLRYVPKLVGEGYCLRVGALKPEAEREFIAAQLRWGQSMLAGGG